MKYKANLPIHDLIHEKKHPSSAPESKRTFLIRGGSWNEASLLGALELGVSCMAICEMVE
jgi:hypothetical protein